MDREVWYRLSEEEARFILSLPLKWKHEYSELVSKGDIIKELGLYEKLRSVDSATPKDSWELQGEELFCNGYMAEANPWGFLIPLTKDALLQMWRRTLVV